MRRKKTWKTTRRSLGMQELLCNLIERHILLSERMTTVTTKRSSWMMPTRFRRRRCWIQRRKRRISFCRIVRVTTTRKRLPRENRTGQEKIRHRKKSKVQEKSVLDDSSDEELDMLHPSRPRTQLRSQTPRKATISNQSLGIRP